MLFELFVCLDIMFWDPLYIAVSGSSDIGGAIMQIKLF